MAVRVIPARTNPAVITPEKTEIPKKRVAAYCRVSTELEEQESSYEAQISHYTQFIREHPLWELAGIYADEGITGTSTRHRDAFNSMIADCEKDKIDMVITKSISRFARNTLDCLKYIRQLKALGIPVFFEKENINTMDPRGEMLITIMASIAQQESASISQNVRMGVQYRFQQGKTKMNCTYFLGFSRENGSNQLEIVPEEADIVRRIYRDFLDGMTIGEIAQDLERDQIKTPMGKDRWCRSTIISILKNEKYMGDLLLQKYYVQDFLTKKVVRNEGALPQYYVECDHDPIVPREIFGQVQGEFLRRERVRVETGRRENHRNDLSLNGKIFCSRCSNTYRRFYRKETDRADWICRTRSEDRQSCGARPVREIDVKEAIVRAFQVLPKRKEELFLLRRSSAPLRESEKRIRALSEEETILIGKIDALLQHPEKDVPEEEVQALQTQLCAVRKEKEQRQLEKAERDARYARAGTLLEVISAMEGNVPEDYSGRPPACSDYVDFMERTGCRCRPESDKVFDDRDTIRYVECVTVYGDHLEVRFKAGLCVDVDV